MNFRLGGSKKNGFDQTDDGRIVMTKGTMQDFYDIFKKTTKIPSYRGLPDDVFNDETLAKFDDYSKRFAEKLSDNTLHRKRIQWFEI